MKGIFDFQSVFLFSVADSAGDDLYNLITPLSFNRLHAITYNGPTINPSPPISFKPINNEPSVNNGCSPMVLPTILGSTICRTTVITPHKINNRIIRYILHI